MSPVEFGLFLFPSLQCLIYFRVDLVGSSQLVGQNCIPLSSLQPGNVYLAWSAFIGWEFVTNMHTALSDIMKVMAVIMVNTLLLTYAGFLPGFCKRGKGLR